jgi:hypothetical protein
MDGMRLSDSVVLTAGSVCVENRRKRIAKTLTHDFVSGRIRVVHREAPGRLDSKLFPATASGNLFQQA